MKWTAKVTVTKEYDVEVEADDEATAIKLIENMSDTTLNKDFTLLDESLDWDDLQSDREEEEEEEEGEDED